MPNRARMQGTPGPTPGRGTVVAVLDTVGNVLVLQLAFLVCSIGVITVAPAAVALQRQFRALRDGTPSGVTPFLREFGTAMRRGWPIGVLLPAVSLGIGLGVPFWLQVDGGAGVLAAAVLVAFGGLAAGLWLSLLAGVDQRPDAVGNWRGWLAEGWTTLVRSPLRALWGVVLLACWLAVELSVPAVVLVGSGVVPMVIAWGTLVLRSHRTEVDGAVVDPGRGIDSGLADDEVDQAKRS